MKIIITIIISIVSFSAQSSLVSRLGGLAVYDTDLNITWLADANAGAGSIFDNGVSTTDGRMDWVNANAWANSLTVGGFNDWRLPTTMEQDLGCTTPTTSTGVGCTGSEMGHLFYNELSGVGGSSVLITNDPDLALFSNIQSDVYWSDTERPTAAISVEAWDFFFHNGSQQLSFKSNALFAWAVRTGDVSAIPVPATVWLFGTGLIGLLGYSRNRKKMAS